ncbi:putative cytochrome P450 [Macroventuria anomochaeta]|uniref:Cytochrome P450 n=1 Tax=Macroventuria anomochaeta TaxID=301207 RepID=A0ACB6S072_9PLEO|nr:putative cytochrome P450 [Macroventuria anomochaeta]KAF2627362.1 putative cytochrome P450 [Macroventuria anomochaeta]
MILLFITSSLLLFVGVRIFKWVRNYLQARSYGLPIILLPVSFNEPLWMVFRPLFAWVEYLPFGLGNWYLYTTMGWPTEDGSRSLRRYGENLVLCSPVDNIIATCEPAVVQKVWTETRDIWRMPESQSQLFTFFGQNVSSTHGEDWKRHRKVTVQAFNERTMVGVWSEAKRQTKALKLTLEKERERSLGRVRSTFDILAMQVLAVVAFGQETELTSVPKGHKMSLMESMGFILKHVLLTVVFNSLQAPAFLLPSVLRKLKVSVAEVRLYMEELVLAHMKSTSKPSVLRTRPASLIEAIVSANELEKRGDSSGKPRSYLTDSELYGNIFVFNLGGYETTAATLTFALPFLALHPEIQTWIAEEIDTHAKTHASGKDEESDLGYNDVYPRLLRTRALMYETLRFASPAPLFVKTPLVPVNIDVTTPSGPRTISVKPGTLMGMNQYGAHLSPRWGSDAETFNPKRFISVDEEGEERFQMPEGPAYTAWMIGPRMCPARKFSQVEFAGIMAELLKDWRVEIVREGGESEGEARERVNKVLRDEKYFNVSAHLRRPEVAGVRFVRRS